MDDKSKKCFMCRHLERYYTKGVKEFKRTKYGWCCVKVGNVNIHDSCERYEMKSPKKKVNPLIRYTLNELLTQISEVRKVLQEEKREVQEDEDM